MHLIELYARDLGVKIGYPVLQPHFFPILEEKYLTFHSSDKVPAKNYSYWPDVIKILKPELEKRNIKIIQIGSKDDKEVEGVDKFFNIGSFKQSSYFIQKALLHFGIDSAPVHIASALNKPTISIYAHTYPKTCNPLWNQDKAILIESDRGGKKPSFSNHEEPKEIDRIKPEEIAESVFKLLNIREYNSQKTIFIGRKYLNKVIDVIPTIPPTKINISDAVVRIRMDLSYNPVILKDILQYTHGQVEIITRKPLKKELINAYKSKISKIVYEDFSFSKSFLGLLHSSGIPFELYCLNEKRLSEERLKHFNFEINSFDKEREAQELYEKYKDLPQELRFYSGRYYLEGDKTYSTISRNENDFNFWIDAKYFRVYTEVSKSL